MKKILFMINTLDGGGAERVLVNLLSHLPADKFEITLVTLFSSGIYDKYLPANVKHKYLFKRRGKKFNRIMCAILCRIIPRKIVYRWFFKEKFDYEIAYLQGFPTQLIHASSNKNSQKITFVHSDFSTNYDVEKLYRSTNECLKAYRDFDKVCFVSQSALAGFEKKVGALNNAYVVHNVLDTKFIQEQALQKREVEFQKDKIRIITVGRLVNLKAIDRLIFAVERVKKDFPNIECFIVGDGDE
jgi:glycosyltransferase involved in cell wall biosynthesis